MSTPNTCDVDGCSYSDEVPIDTDSGIPAGWSKLYVADATGEHQAHLVCPKHNEKLWSLLSGEWFT